MLGCPNVLTRCLLLLACAAPATTFKVPANGLVGRTAAAGSSTPLMLLNLAPPLPLRGLWDPSAPPKKEVLYEGRTQVDFQMETLHLTKRRVSGGVQVDASPQAIWEVLTAYERMPETIPNILSNVVTRDAASGRVTIEQESLLSNRLNLITSMVLEAVEVREAQQLELRRVSGHGFLEFEGKYTLTPRGGGTYLAYSVEMTPCPIFPLPLVERKIRKEVPKMLTAVAAAAQQAEAQLAPGAPRV